VTCPQGPLLRAFCSELLVGENGMNLALDLSAVGLLASVTGGAPFSLVPPMGGLIGKRDLTSVLFGGRGSPLLLGWALVPRTPQLWSACSGR
jgi:hypothetical protein